jgi:RNA polymerase sigma-54 factor
MIKIITVIASMQPTFFKTGDIKDLKPMILQDIATKTGYDISTISRVTSNKYVQTPHGIFILKKLFMRSINPDVGINSPKTSVVIQDEIKKIVEAEDKSNPLSDNSIVKKLAKMGITLARRTVVKYRETLDIPNSTLRKQ